jgi:hypothetical protein
MQCILLPSGPAAEEARRNRIARTAGGDSLGLPAAVPHADHPIFRFCRRIGTNRMFGLVTASQIALASVVSRSSAA